MNRQETYAWQEYDSVAAWCAKHKFLGVLGDPLPNLVSKATHDLINADPEAFEDRVREHAYALSMEKVGVL